MIEPFLWQKAVTIVWWADNSVRNWWNLPISNPKPGLHNINAHTEFGENPLIFTQIIVQNFSKTKFLSLSFVAVYFFQAEEFLKDKVHELQTAHRIAVTYVFI